MSHFEISRSFYASLIAFLFFVLAIPATIFFIPGKTTVANPLNPPNQQYPLNPLIANADSNKEGTFKDIRVGVYQNRPKIYIDDQGQAQGFYIRLLQYIAEKESWRLVFVAGDWKHCMNNLAHGNIDIMPDVGYSSKRAQHYHFNEQTLIVNWAQVYSRQDIDVESLMDMQSLCVATMAGSIHTDGPEGIKNLLQRFDIGAGFMEVANYNQVMQSLEDKRCDVGITNRIFGQLYENKFKVKKTSIVFNPIQLRFAFPANQKQSKYLARRIDYHLVKLKNNSNSVYYAALDEMFGRETFRDVYHPPRWFYYLILITIGSVLFLAVMSWLLKVQVNRKTAEIWALNRSLEGKIIARTHDLTQATLAAQRANQAKSVFLATMSHEIRTPMNAILGYSQILQRDQKLTKKQRAMIQAINASGDHLLVLINDVLDMSKIEAGQTRLNLDVFDSHALIEDMRILFQGRAQDKGLEFIIERDPLPQFLEGDSEKLRRILINLLGNAFKFTQTGFVELRISIDSDSDQASIKDNMIGEKILLNVEVCDTGMGIDEQHLGHIFEPFEQIPGDKKSGGTGLGLAISRDYARLLGGDISVVSHRKKGSRFRLQCPVTIAPKQKMVRNGIIPGRIRQLQPEYFGTKVLVVDDRQSNRDILVQMLSPLGFMVQQAADGLQAIQLFARWLPKVVLLDVVMPQMDGRELCTRLRSLPGGRKVAIIALSASALDDQRQSVLASGANAFVAKPFKENTLLIEIQKFSGVEYIYGEESLTLEENKSQGTVGIFDKTTTSEKIRFDLGQFVERLKPLHPELKKKLLEFSTLGDTQSLDLLCDSIGYAHATLALILRELIDEFEFDTIIDALGKGESL